MNSIKDFALNMLMNSPMVAGNPNAQEFVRVLQNGDSVRGQQIADNICSTYGMSREDAVAQAKQFFRLN